MPSPVRMSTVSPAPNSPSGPPSSRLASRFGLSKRAWWLIGGGFGLGFLMFFLLWLDQRNDRDFYRPERAVDGPAGQVFDPLPTPQTDGSGRSASGMSEAAREIAERPRPVEPRPVPPTQTAPAQRPVDSPRPVAQQRPSQTLAPGSVPKPIERVPPKYPADAQRNRESGTVVVRVEVDAEGKPSDVSVQRSSRSRSLDRAAMQAAKKWRFQPAQRDGRAVAGSVNIPFDFTLPDR